MNLNDLDNINQEDAEEVIDAFFIEGTNKIRSLQFMDAESYLEKAYSLSLDLVLKKSQNEPNKTLIDKYEAKFADIFSKYTYDLYLQNSKNPVKFTEVVTKFKKQNDEIFKELNQKCMEVFLTDCENYYQKYTTDLNPSFYMTWNPFSYMVQKLESDKSGYSLQTLVQYLKIIKRCYTSLKSSTVNEVSCAIMNNFINYYQIELKTHKKKLRTVDETKFKNFIFYLQKFLKGPNLKQLEKFENDVLFDFLMSDLLGKQFYALSRFNSFPTFSKDLIEQFRQRDVVNKLLYKSNLHHELIQQFSIFLSKLFNYGFYEDSIIEQLWTRTFEKSDELEDYFKAWPILQSTIPSKNQKFFWNLILKKTPSFSSPYIRTFLIQIAPTCSEKDKTEMVDLLWKSAISESSNSEEFVDIINEYIPADNDYRINLKKRCFSLFESDDTDSGDDKVMFALKLLIKIWKSSTEDEPSEDFDFLLKNCKLTMNNAFTLLTLLSTIAGNFSHPFTDEELELIKHQVIEIVSINSMYVFNFIQKLMTIQKGHLFTPHLLFSLLDWMSKLPTVDSVTFKLIRSLYEMIHSMMHSKSHKKEKNSEKNIESNDDQTDYLNMAVDSLWSLLYRTTIPDVADFLVKLHLKKVFDRFKTKKKPHKNKKKKKSSKKNSKAKGQITSENSTTNEGNDETAALFINEFIDKCFQKLNCFGSLTALYFLILEIEDSLSLEKYNIQRNGYNGYKQTLTILLTKDYTGEVSIPEGTSYYTFRKIVRDLVKLNDSQITLMAGPTKLDQNHIFRNNEKIKVFFNTFEEEENSNVIGKVPTSNNNNNSDSDSDSSDSNNDSSDSSSSSFSFDINSCNIEWKKENLPSQILCKYRSDIKDLLEDKDTLICEASLNLLNLLSIDEKEVDLLKTKSDLFDVNHPFLFLYRLNLLANLIAKKDIDVLKNIYDSDLYSQLMNIVFKTDRNLFTKDEYFDLLLETTVDINKIGSEMKELKKSKRNCMKELLNDSDSSLSLIVNWVIEEEKMKPVNTLRVVDYLVILADYIQIDKKILLDHQRFPEFFDLSIFNENRSIRLDFYNLLTYIKPFRLQEFVLSRLNLSRKKNCVEFFQLFKRIAKFSQSFENRKFLFDTLVDTLNDYLFIYNDVNVKTDDKSLIDAVRDLCADMACPEFIKGVIDNLENLFTSVYSKKATNEQDDEEEETKENENEEDKKKEKKDEKKNKNKNNEDKKKKKNKDDDDKKFNEDEKKDKKKKKNKDQDKNNEDKKKKKDYDEENKNVDDKKFDEMKDAVEVDPSDVELIKKPELLLHILVDKIVFNTNRYVYSPPSLFSVVKMILNRFPSLFPPLIESLTNFNESIQIVKNQYLNLYMPDKKTEKGLNNLGCTCYLNASIQQLFHIKEIRDAIFSYNPGEESGISSNWLCQLQLLMANLKYAPLPSIDASGFVNNWSMYGNEPIDPNEQQDAIEFLQILLDRLDEKIPGRPISKCVRGQIIHTIKQINGDFQSQSFEDFITFTLEVINKKNFSDSFDAFLEPDIFDNDNKYNVEEIGQIDATRYHAIKKEPEILIFQLKRFDFDLSSLTRKKINSAYQIDMEVDISRLLWNKENNSPCIYELFGIIEHSGNAEGGHYISFIKSSDIHDEEKSPSSVWRVYNDSRVSVIDESEVIKSATGGAYTRRFYDPVNKTIKTFQSTKIDSAYILFYRKKKEETDIQIEEEEEDRSDTTITNTNNNNDNNKVVEPIQFMPEIMLHEFFKNMKRLILRHVLFSNEYISFIDYISKVDNFDTFSFIYNYTMKSIVSTSNQFKKSSIIQTAMKKASSDLNFARYILKKENNLLINTLLNYTEEKQASICCSLADEAILVVFKANKEKRLYNEDIEFIDEIISNEEELINNADKFDYIFRPFYFYLVLGNATLELSKKYLNFFLDLLESIQKRSKSKDNLKKYKSAFISTSNNNDNDNDANIGIGETQNISFINESTKISLKSSNHIDFKNIDMLHAFKSMVFLIEQNDFEKDDPDFFNSMKKRVVNHEFLDHWSQSRFHSVSFNCFVVHLLKDDKKMTKKYFNFISNANHVLIENDQTEEGETETENSEKSDVEIRSKGKVKFKLTKNKNKSKSGHHDHDHIQKVSSRKSVQKMTIQTLSAIFVNLLTFEDSLTSYRVDWFLSFTEKLKWTHIECGNFLRESSTNVRDHCTEFDILANFSKNKNEKLNADNQSLIINPYPLFDSDSPYLFKKFLLSEDSFIRSSCLSFIYSVFPSFPKVKLINGKVSTETEKTVTTVTNPTSNNIISNNNSYGNMSTVTFRKESDKIEPTNNSANYSSADSDATEDANVAHADNDDDKNKDSEAVVDSPQKICELQTLVKIFSVLIEMTKTVTAVSKEIAANIEDYRGNKAIPTDSFFELLSWVSFHLIDNSGENKDGLRSNENDFLVNFDLSNYSSTFSMLVTKFSSFKNSVRCCVIDLLKYVYIVHSKSDTSKKKNVLIDASNSMVYLNALSKFPSTYETTSFVENATMYFIPIITPFVEKIEGQVLKSKFVEMSIKNTLNTKSSAATNSFVKNMKHDDSNDSDGEENYYNTSNLNAISNVQAGSIDFIGAVISEFIYKLKVSERLCTLLWKKRKTVSWGKSPLLLKITYDVLKTKGWTVAHYFTEFECMEFIFQEFMSQHEIQQLNYYTWELMMDVIHSYNGCYIQKEKGKMKKGENEDELSDENSDNNGSEVKSSENRKSKNSNSKGSHNFMKKFNKNFIELWKSHFKFLSIINGYLKKATVNFCFAALKVLSDVILHGGLFSPEIAQFGLNLISSESEAFYPCMKSDKIREKYVKFEIQIIRNGCKNGYNDKKSKKSKNKSSSSYNDTDENIDADNNGYGLIERDVKRLLQAKIFNCKLFELFLNEIESDEVKSQIYVNFLTTFNDFSQIDEPFVTEAIEILKKNGHQIKPKSDNGNKIIMTKKEKKKFDEKNKETDKDVDNIISNLNSLIEAELLRMTKSMGATDASEIMDHLSIAEKMAVLLTTELNAKVKYVAVKKNEVEKAVDELKSRRSNKEVYEYLYQVVERILTNNVNKK